MSRPVDVLTDAEGNLAEDLACSGCGYNLRTLYPFATCPECGNAIGESIAQRSLHRLGGWTVYRFGWLSRALSVIYGIVVPVFVFLIAEAMDRPIFLEYQTDRWEDYVSILLGGVPARPFYPFVLLAMGSLFVLIVRPTTMARYRTVRIGVWTGVVIGAQYLLILFSKGGIKHLIIASVILGVSGFCAALIWRVRWKFSMSRRARQVAWMLLAAGLLVTIVANVLIPDTMAIWAVAFFGSLAGAPIWFVLVYLAMAARIARSEIVPIDTGRSLPAWIVGWFSGYVAAWSGAIVLAIETYQNLPTKPPPGCYIATAAARGHRQWVRSETIVTQQGQRIIVNRQLRVLKCAELAAKSLLPRIHRVGRLVYDTCGPLLARILFCPLFADVAFALLRPLEWLALWMLRSLVPDIDERMGALYSRPKLQSPDVR